MNAVTALIAALAISLAGNGVLVWAYLGKRDAVAVALEKVTATAGERDDARLLASSCSDAVDDLRELAEKRRLEAEGIRLQVETTAKNHDSRADVILSTPQAVPGDSCASAQVLIDDWLTGRKTQ